MSDSRRGDFALVHRRLLPTMTAMFPQVTELEMTTAATAQTERDARGFFPCTLFAINSDGPESNLLSLKALK